ncbi:hypothetical protein KJ554_07765 [bacterium]|nr:hypothetical protein [bacterium]
MSAEAARGPGGLVLHEAGLDPSRLDLIGGPAAWTALPAMGLREFADAQLRGDDASRVCIFLDAPGRTATRAVAALAVARYLLALDRSVVVVDGDDQRPDLSRWAGRQETEGWVDVVRYGISPRAASVPLPWGPQDGRVMGVGSYHPVRAEPGEAEDLCERLLEAYDTVLVCASTGDRGAFWAALPALRVICWDRAQATPEETAVLIRDAAVLGASMDAAIAFGVSRRAVRADDGTTLADASAGTPRRSSPIFRRLTISLAVLVVVLGIWILGQLARDDTPPVTLPGPEVVVQPERTPPDSAAIDTLAQIPGDSPRLAVADTPVPAAADSASADAIQTAVAEEPSTAQGIDWTGPVADGVYCLHVYSMADSTMAREQLQWMERRGVVGMVRRWRDADGKVWFRIYAGSFATLREARAAQPDLFERLDTDWAMPKLTGNLR